MKISQSMKTVTFLRYTYKNSDAQVSFSERILKVSKAKLFSLAAALSHFNCNVDNSLKLLGIHFEVPLVKINSEEDEMKSDFNMRTRRPFLEFI